MSLCLLSPRRSNFVLSTSNKRQRLAALAVCSAALLSGCGGHSSTPVATAGYTFTNFDYTNATGGTVPTAINNNGIIVGYTPAAIRPYTCFYRNTDGTFTPLVFSNSGTDISHQVTANGFNDTNLVVGAMLGATGTTAFEAANLVTSAPISLLPPVNANTTTQTALGTNNSGFVVGQYFDSATGITPGFVYANQAYTIIDPAPAEGQASGVTYAQSINNNGIVVGSFAVNGNSILQGFAYSMSTGKYTFLPSPSTSRITATITLASTRFMAINDNNEAAGYYQTSDGSQYAFVFNLATQTYTYLDDPSATEASGYNNVQSTKITGINNSAMICGTYTDGAFVSHAFIATLH